MSYQLVELLQLVFALVVMFAAFVGGIAVGWWRWGRPYAERRKSAGRATVPPAGLFSAHERTDDSRSEPAGSRPAVVDLSTPRRVPTFGAATREIGVGTDNT
jgi:hypothetical protein